MKPRQFEMPVLASVFNLAGETGEDPFRLERERWEAEQRAAEARAFEARMQRTLAECPGFIGADAPSSEKGRGRVVVEPAQVMEARTWLKRRFHVADAVEVDAGQGLVLEVAPRVRKAAGAREVKPRFGKPEQFSLKLEAQ